mmetsp:Transcript_4117/g.12771  ORF Transcript_4117/g.12771 Transcript_4117/m.12771 type:complete len:314 (+) Transcript_4117:3526-4467(+)
MNSCWVSSWQVLVSSKSPSSFDSSILSSSASSDASNADATALANARVEASATPSSEDSNRGFNKERPASTSPRGRSASSAQASLAIKAASCSRRSLCVENVWKAATRPGKTKAALCAKYCGLVFTTSKPSLATSPQAPVERQCSNRFSFAPFKTWPLSPATASKSRQSPLRINANAADSPSRHVCSANKDAVVSKALAFLFHTAAVFLDVAASTPACAAPIAASSQPAEKARWKAWCGRQVGETTFSRAASRRTYNSTASSRGGFPTVCAPRTEMTTPLSAVVTESLREKSYHLRSPLAGTIICPFTQTSLGT